MTMTMTGMSTLEAAFDAMVLKAEDKIVDTRKRVALELVEALITRIPVWSGRAVRSIAVTSGSAGNSTEPHPDRGGTAKDGKWASHPEWAGEAMRQGAESVARASAQSADYGLDSTVVVTSSSYLWQEIDTRQHSYSNPVRQTPVISEIAIAQVKAMFPGVLK